MKHIAILLVLATATAQLAEPGSRKFCCTPPQWEGTQAGVGGYVAGGQGTALTSNSRVAFDRDNRRVYAYTNTTAQKKTSVKIIQDFKQGYQWVIDVYGQQCSKTKLSTPFNEGCIPDDATQMGQFYFGTDSEQLDVKSFSLRMKSPGTLLDVFISVTKKQCVPVSETFVGSSNRVPMLIVMGFVDVTPGIRDPSVFTPPSICQQNATIELPPAHIEPEFRIFHI